VPDAVRRSVIETIAEKMGVTTPVRKLLALLAEGHRLELLPELAQAYHERLLAHQNIVRAEVASAAPLSDENTQALDTSLARVTGKKVHLSVTVDPDLLGGLIARIGSTVYDGSVRTQLKKIRQALVD
jgi:F-type H+-transporting ATPase subunit delta